MEVEVGVGDGIGRGTVEFSLSHGRAGLAFLTDFPKALDFKVARRSVERDELVFALPRGDKGVRFGEG